MHWYLVDELLVEIFCRLPCHKTVTLCKLVCKHWAALVSEPFFVSRFVAFRAGQSIAPCAYEDGISKYDERRVEMMNDQTFGIVIPLPPNLTVVRACNDLLLYQRHGDKIYNSKFELYICNAQTKQCLAFPSLDLPSMTRNIGNIGFMCDPYYSRDTSREVSELPAYLLSPYTGGVWREVILSLPLRCKLLCKCPIASIGRKLYVPCCGCLNGFDPFVDVSNGTSKDIGIQCDSIPTSPSLVTTITFFGVFHEQLYMCDCEDSGRYRVWVLKDYVTGEWSLRHNIMGQDWIPHDLYLVKLINRKPIFENTIGFHPTTSDVIYVLSKR
ncbi:hypothetical protein RND81_06G119400 [Saponaria officinalis]|uniref:F-box domain-containing protein n=1 Tax=Saponaria officinalis TaxID=3572 RepID=A0AAW1K5X1_SAPOF